MRSLITSGIACLLVVVVGCGTPALKGAGEACVASSECADGLVCDLGQSPPVCAGMVTADATVVDSPEVPIDAAETDGAAIDAAAIDAPIDAAVDAAVDAAIDAAIDAI